MAKIDRFSGNVAPFASQADTNDRTTFGTTATGVDTLDGNVTTEFLEGWAIVGPNEFPSLQDFNAVGFTLGQYIAYLHQMGVAEWNGTQEYQIGSVANRNGVLYVCQTADHVSATAPEDDAVNWKNETQIQAALAYAVSQLSSGDKTKVGLLIDGTVVDALDYVVYPIDLTVWSTNGATGASDGTLNTGTGVAGGVTGTLTRVGAVSDVGDQTIAGVKTFSASPVVPVATDDTGALQRGQINQANSVEIKAALSASGLAPIAAARGFAIIEWVTGVPTLRSSINVDSISDDGVGLATVTWSVGLPTHYGVIGQTYKNSAEAVPRIVVHDADSMTRTSTQFQFAVEQGNDGSRSDPQFVILIVVA